MRFVMGLVVFLLLAPQSGLNFYPLEAYCSGSHRIDPYERICIGRISADEGDRLEGNFTADDMAVTFYIFPYMGFSDHNEYISTMAIYEDYGMVCFFDFVLNIDTDLLIFGENENNLTQYVHYFCNIYYPESRVLIESLPYYVIISLPLLVIILCPITYARWKKSQV